MSRSLPPGLLVTYRGESTTLPPNQQPSSFSRPTSSQRHRASTLGALRTDAAQERGEHLEGLAAKAKDLADGSAEFLKMAKALSRT